MNAELTAVLEASGLTEKDIMSRRRFWEFVRPRIVYARLRTDMGYGLSAIGRELGVSHSTVYHYLHTYDQDIIYNDDMKTLWSKTIEIYRTIKESNNE